MQAFWVALSWALLSFDPDFPPFSGVCAWAGDALGQNNGNNQVSRMMRSRHLEYDHLILPYC